MQADQQAARLVSAASQREGFVCPDSPLPISRALHLARLSAGWSVCDTCASRSETTGLSPQTLSSIRRIEQRFGDQVIRVAAGIRGRHLNALTRSLAGDLIVIFVHSIAVRPAGTAAGSLAS